MSSNPAGTVGAQAPDARAQADVFHALVAAMAGKPEGHGKPKSATATTPNAPSRGDQDDEDVKKKAVDAILVAPIAPTAVAVQTTPGMDSRNPFPESSGQPSRSQVSGAAMLKALAPSPLVAAHRGVQLGQKSEPASADDSSVDVHPTVEAHKAGHALPIELANFAGEGSADEQSGDTHKPSQNFKLAEPKVTVRTELPQFALTAAPAARVRAAVPVAINAPAAPAPAPIAPLVVPPHLREIAPLPVRVTTPLVMTLPAPVDDVAPQIVQTIRMAWSRGAGEAQIRLDPRQFGDVSVSLRVEAGQVVARIQADAPAVREWLQSNQRTLQDGLAEYQLRLGKLEVTAPPDESRDSAGSRERRRDAPTEDPPARRPRRDENTSQFEVVA